jgi:hypothetical protein
MKNSIFKVLALSAATLLVFSGVSLAQTKDDDDRRAISAASSIYVISAKAGGVNYTEGKVAVNRKNGKSGYLIKGDSLEIGDKVSTGADGKAEILLNPGSFVRLAENTEFEFITTSLEDLKIKLTRGSAMFEVFAANEFRVAVSAPKTDFYLVKSGVYRIDVPNDAAAVIDVWKGSAQVGDGATAALKSGQRATVSGGEVAVAKFDRDEKDSLEQWSKDRSKQLAKINASLDRRTLRTSLLSSFRSWNMYDSFGLWVYNPFSGSYCFLPFGYGWRSPYGFGFGRDIWSVPLPPVITSAPAPIRTNNPPPPTKNPGLLGPGGRTQTDSATTRSGEEVRVIRPPYTKVQQDVGSGFPSTSFPSEVDRFPGRSPSRVVVDTPSAAPAPVQPPPGKSPGRIRDN